MIHRAIARRRLEEQRRRQALIVRLYGLAVFVSVAILALSVHRHGVWVTAYLLGLCGFAAFSVLYYCYNPNVDALLQAWFSWNLKPILYRAKSHALKVCDFDAAMPAAWDAIDNGDENGDENGDCLDAVEFYQEYHGHRPEHLALLCTRLRKSLADSADASPGTRWPRLANDSVPQFIYLVGDSTLDNKHWLFEGIEAGKSMSASAGSFIAEAINGYERVLQPPLMVKDVCYWLVVRVNNKEAEGRFGSGRVLAVNAAVEESTTQDRIDASSADLDLCPGSRAKEEEGEEGEGEGEEEGEASTSLARAADIEIESEQCEGDTRGRVGLYTRTRSRSRSTRGSGRGSGRGRGRGRSSGSRSSGSSRSSRSGSRSGSSSGSSSGSATMKLLAQDALVRWAVTDRDMLILSLGGNDIALRPTLQTALNMLLLARGAPTWLLRARPALAPGFGYLLRMLHQRYQQLVTRLCEGQRPRKVLVCVLYYPCTSAMVPAWADDVLNMLGYDSDPSKLQLVVRQLFTAMCKRGFEVKGMAEGSIEAFPLFEALDPECSADYEQRVEPSVQGGKKMAQAFLDALVGDSIGVSS